MKTEKPPTAASQRWRYYPEIDGLRAVAVLAVFFFHLSPNILRGGFVGVDTFFVISGYLISSVLLQDMDQRKFSILRFYQHRIARIAPSLFLVLLVTLFAGWLIYSAQDFASLGANAAFAAISAINIKLISQGTYFQISPDAQPLIHYWTLSVEEQFYLLFPFYLYLVVKSRHATVITALLCAVSFALCVVLTNSQPEFSFYMLPTRAWELLAGAMLALLQRSNFELRTLSASAAGPIGVVILALSVFTIQGGQSFPGWIAAFPCLGSFLILLSVQKQAGLVSRMLSAPFAVFIGKRSYALYLWHWPIFSFVDYSLFQSSALLRTSLKIGLTVACAMASYEFFEWPARRFLNRPDKRLFAIVGFGVVAALILVSGIYIRRHDYFAVDTRTIRSGGISVNAESHKSVALIGDSQAAMYGTELASIARAQDFHLNALGVSGGNELFGETDSLWPEVKTYLAAQHPDIVILAEAWSEKFGGNTDGLRRAIAAIAPYTKRIVILEQPPIAPPQMSREAIRGGAHAPFFERPQDGEARVLADRAIQNAAGENIEILDVAKALLAPDRAIVVFTPNGRLTYMNPEHLSDSGTALVHPLLAQELERTFTTIAR